MRSWAVLGTLWGEIRPRTGRESTGETGPLAINMFRIIVRGAPMGDDSRPLAGQRFRTAGRVYHILAVTESEPDGMYLTCETREEVAA